jgi:hypothetical protein
MRDKTNIISLNEDSGKTDQHGTLMDNFIRGASTRPCMLCSVICHSVLLTVVFCDMSWRAADCCVL